MLNWYLKTWKTEISKKKKDDIKKLVIQELGVSEYDKIKTKLEYAFAGKCFRICGHVVRK